MRRILILGSTGAIGTQALEVAEQSDDLEVVGLAARTSWERVLAQATAHGVTRVALADEGAAADAGRAWSGGDVLGGAEGLVELITDTDCDLVLNALAGAAGLGPTIAALGEGIDLALANRESLVVGGELVTALAEATGATVVPVDAGVSALQQLIPERPGQVDGIVLTASGAPYRDGGRPAVDDATLMGRGFELIEAHHLLGVPAERIDVVLHPQAVVRALVHLNDGATLAHLGYPDMRVPISYALHQPERADVPVPTLDLAALGELSFAAPDAADYPALRLAREALRAGGTAPCVLNAADEVAVAAFLAGELSFEAIAAVVEGALAALPPGPVGHFSDIYRADAAAREAARELVRERAAAAVTVERA